MKTILSFILLALFTTTKAQINFSSQANGNAVTFSVTQMGQFYENITWYFGDGTTAYGQTANHTYSTSGNFSVCVIGSPMPMAQQDTMCKFVNILTTGAIENETENTITVYPNPLQDQLNLSISSKGENKHLSLTDVQGRVLLSQHIINSLSTIDMKRFSPGLYFLTIRDNSSTHVFKIVKD